MHRDLEQKYHDLRASVAALGSVVVAFSGGIDSALVLAIAARELGDRALGVTGVSSSLSRREKESAAAFAAGIGAHHTTIVTKELEDERYASNPVNRCYFCKNELYAKLCAFAAERGFDHVADGSNLDDTRDHRPGRTAAAERGVVSPLIESGFTKHDVRMLSKELGLVIWDKPALACLSSRFPHGTAITQQLLERVEQAEDVLYRAGLRAFRVRHHDSIARIEVPLEDLQLVLEPERREAILTGVRNAGYAHVTLDLGGYRAPAQPLSGEKLISLL